MTAELIKRTKRVVTVNDPHGNSGFHENQVPPRVAVYEHTAGMATSILWATGPDSRLNERFADPVPTLQSLHPGVGESVFMLLTLPPESVYAAPDFNFGAAVQEQAELAPGLAERFEQDAPGFHSTETIDYVTVLDGEVWLETDEQETRLSKFDVVVQRGTRHAWRNKSDAPATLSVVLIGARRNGS